jgi:hypothetical protein
MLCATKVTGEAIGPIRGLGPTRGYSQQAFSFQIVYPIALLMLFLTAYLFKTTPLNDEVQNFMMRIR